MGLDLYVNHLSKTSQETSMMIFEVHADTFVLGRNWLEGTYLGKFNDRIFQKDLFLQKYGFDCDDYGCSSSGNVIEWFDREKTLLVLTREEYNSLFNDNFVPAYFFNAEDVAYQRKGIDEEGWKILYEIGNCVYSRDLEKIENLVKHGLDSKFLDVLKNDEESVFMAWW